MTDKEKPHMEDKVVEFRSTPENYEHECKGEKPNTLRKIGVYDERFECLRSGKAKLIKIKLTIGDSYFVREITNYTEYRGWAIISWKDQSQSLSAALGALERVEKELNDFIYSQYYEPLTDNGTSVEVIEYFRDRAEQDTNKALARAKKEIIKEYGGKE